MVFGYLIVDGMRPGTLLEGIPLSLTKVDRQRVKHPASGQPDVWTTIEFTFREEDAGRLAQALADVLEERGWYTDFKVNDEKFVIFAHRVFRYRPGDKTSRAEAQAYGRLVGVPDRQLDWDD